MTQVFIVTKNTDFIEGRGPMIFNRVFDTFEAAEFYVLNQYGISGSKQGPSGYGTETIITYNGYDILIAELETFASYEAEKLIKDEIDKLKTRITTLDLEKVKNAYSKYNG